MQELQAKIRLNHSGGRTTGIRTGYIATIRIDDLYTAAGICLQSCTELEPGGSCMAKLRLPNHEYVEGKLHPGSRFTLTEGEREIGVGVVVSLDGIGGRPDAVESTTRLAASFLPTMVGLAAYLLLGVFASSIYRALLPGVPDSGAVPFALLPSLLLFYVGYLDPAIYLVWLISCSAYFFPPALAVISSASRGRRWGGLIVVLISLHALWSIWGSRAIYFSERYYSTAAALWVTTRSYLPILVLSVAGVLFGWRFRRRRVRGVGA